MAQDDVVINFDTDFDAWGGDGEKLVRDWGARSRDFIFKFY